MKQANEAIDSFCDSYDGLFGKFTADAENDDNFAMAEHAIKHRHVSASSIVITTGDADSMYGEKLEFVKQESRPIPMGTPVELPVKFGFDEEYGTINNFSKFGVKGGILYFAGRLGDAVFCLQMFSVKKQISDGELKELMDAVKACLE